MMAIRRRFLESQPREPALLDGGHRREVPIPRHIVPRRQLSGKGSLRSGWAMVMLNAVEFLRDYLLLAAIHRASINWNPSIDMQFSG
jgi:hypothetical protein